MKRGADVIAFPRRVPIRCEEDSAPRAGFDSAIVIILPVVRIETYPHAAAARRAPRRPNNGGDAA